MNPILGWTMLSRHEIGQVERLTRGDQEVRDEIGFLLIHQGFADRFFPGTSVLQTRLRYALFVPWLYQQAAATKRRGSDLEATIRRLLILLAIRLKQLGGEPYDVIGGDKLGQLTSQPPDHVYWTALRKWGILLPGVQTRSEALLRLQAAARSTALDDDGGPLDDAVTEVFTGLPRSPDGWEDPECPLRFKMPAREQDFMRRKLSLLTRQGEEVPSLLARLVQARNSFQKSSTELPKELDAWADDSDKRALSIARDAASLAAIGRAVYGALVEDLLSRDGAANQRIICTQLNAHFESYGESAANCDVEQAKVFLPTLPDYFMTVLRETQKYVRDGQPAQFRRLHGCYQVAEVRRKRAIRARLLDNQRAAQLRSEWDATRHNTTPLHYRWHIVRDILKDLSLPE